MSKLYMHFYGVRLPFTDNTVKYNVDGGPDQKLPLYLEDVNHSPTGFEWGYNGSGPAQLAYAILKKFFMIDMTYARSKEFALGYYSQFKEDFVMKFGEYWEIDNTTIENWYLEQLDKR